MAAALELRHDVFCVEQGVPEHEELDGRDHEAIHLVAVADQELRRDLPRLDGRLDRSVQPAGGARSARRRGIATALLEAADEETRAAGGRRLVLHAQTYAQNAVRARRVSAPRQGVHRSGDRAHRDGEAALSVPEVRIDPLSGHRAIVAGDRAGRPGGEL